MGGIIPNRSWSSFPERPERLRAADASTGPFYCSGDQKVY
jgi:hypothetical protein